MTQSRLASLCGTIFAPPFHYFLAVVWGYYLLCFLIVPSSQILGGNLPDPDDYLYLTQALDLLKGQGWFDPIQHRMNPPVGTFIHFSHLLAGFYALPIGWLTPLFGDAQSAAIVVAAILPLVFFAFFLLALRWAARPLLGDWAGLTGFIVLFASYVMFLFSPGHVDHHGLETLLAIFSLGCAIYTIREPERWHWPILGGYTAALSLVIGLEALPFVAVLTAAIGLWATFRGGRAALAAFCFALTLFIACYGFLLPTRAPDHLFEEDYLSYSIIYVALTGGMALCFTALVALTRLPCALRVVIMGLLAGVIGGGFLYHFPMLKAGPYGGMDPALAKIMFDSISEALPVIRSDSSWIDMALALVWPAMAIAATAWFLAVRRTERWIWALQLLVLGAMALLAAFYQCRFLPYAQVLSVIPLTMALREAWLALPRRFAGCSLCAARLGVLLLAAPLPMVFLPALNDGRPFNTGILAFPNQTLGSSGCDVQTLAKILTLPHYYGDRPRVIMNTLNEGAELLFRTPHAVLAAPFHTNVSGNLDAFQFFRTENVDEARTLATKRGAELVVLCKNVSEMYVPDTDKGVVQIDENGRVRPDGHRSFAQKLADGEVPDWLKPVHMPLLGSMLLFEVRPADKP